LANTCNAFGINLAEQGDRALARLERPDMAVDSQVGTLALGPGLPF